MTSTYTKAFLDYSTQPAHLPEIIKTLLLEIEHEIQRDGAEYHEKGLQRLDECAAFAVELLAQCTLNKAQSLTQSSEILYLFSHYASAMGLDAPEYHLSWNEEQRFKYPSIAQLWNVVFVYQYDNFCPETHIDKCTRDLLQEYFLTCQK